MAPALAFESSAGTRSERHNEWRDRRFDLPAMARYGASKVAKTKLATLTKVLDNSEL
jgi:hypothetical protein